MTPSNAPKGGTKSRRQKASASALAGKDKGLASDALVGDPGVPQLEYKGRTEGPLRLT